MAKYTLDEAKKITGYIREYTQVQSAGTTLMIGKAGLPIFSVGSNSLTARGDFLNLLKGSALSLRAKIDEYKREVPTEIRDRIDFGMPVKDLEVLVAETLKLQ